MNGDYLAAQYRKKAARDEAIQALLKRQECNPDRDAGTGGSPVPSDPVPLDNVPKQNRESGVGSQESESADPRRLIPDSRPLRNENRESGVGSQESHAMTPRLYQHKPAIRACDLKACISPEAQWIWDGYLSRCETTVLTSLWKSGKTTLVAQLAAAIERGDSTFCGRKLQQVPIYLVTEESEEIWTERKQRLGLNKMVFVQSRPFLTRPNRSEWLKLLKGVQEEMQANGVGLLVIDPLANYVSGTENLSKDMLDCLMPLSYLAKETKAGVLILHHPRKGDATEFRAARGSGALGGFVDILMEMRKAVSHEQSRARVLRASGRHSETPAEIVIELAEGDSGYRCIDSLKELHAEGQRNIILNILSGKTQLSWTAHEIKDAWPEDLPPINLRTLQRRLAEGIGKDWTFFGRTDSGLSHRYRLKPADGTVAC